MDEWIAELMDELIHRHYKLDKMLFSIFSNYTIYKYNYVQNMISIQKYTEVY